MSVVAPKVALVGAGKMGLPLACQLASRGAQVTACDKSPRVVEAINAAKCPIDEPGVERLLEEVVRAGRLRATTDTSAAVAASEVVVVIVPALLTSERDVDASVLVAASRDIAKGLQKGALVSYETTLPVGGTRRLLVPVLAASGLEPGRDFDVCFSPERVKSQKVLENLTANRKVVGGLTPAAAERGAAFYARYLGAPVENVGTLEAAELVKVAGMLYRDVNIALANELARYSEAVGVDFPSLLPAINSDGEAHVLQPGIGVGGHCTPVYPYFLIRDGERHGVPLTLAERSRRVNDEQASHAVALLERAWDSVRGKRVLVLGLAFRPGVKEDAYSTAYLVRDALVAKGALVSLHDPLYSADEIRAHGFEPASLEGERAPEAIVLVTAHPEYRDLDWAKLKARGLEAVLDGRNLWSPQVVRAAGLRYASIGKPLDVPAEKRTWPIARPVLRSEEAESAAAVVRSGWVLQGPQVLAFEKEFAAYTGAPFACAVSSGTAALHLALMAAGVGPGDEVVTVSHSYIATANSVRHCGARPVFVDVEPDTFNVDPSKLESAITAKTKAILAVHQLGMPCDLGAILPLARKHNLRVVEDAACAIGSEIELENGWERIGKPHGDLACFSFHPRKVLTTGDGGMVTTASAELDRLVRSWRQHGVTAPAHGTVPEVYGHTGWNYRLTDVQAAIGREQLRRMPVLVSRRREIAALYREALARVPGLGLPREPRWARSNWQSYCVRLPRGTSQARVLEALAARGVATRHGVMNAHLEPAYVGEWRGVSFPESERARAECLVLPLYHEMTRADVDEIARRIQEALGA